MLKLLFVTILMFELSEVFNESRNLTQKCLQSSCKVEEAHPLMSNFRQDGMPVTFLDSFIRHVEEGDSILKKEGAGTAVD